MTETEIRDAYHLAARYKDRREDLWAERSLPVSFDDEVDSRCRLSVSALPEEPHEVILDLGNVDPGVFTVSSGIAGQFWTTYQALQPMRTWSDGVHTDSGMYEGRLPYTLVRLHRDGSAAISHVVESMRFPHLARLVNAELGYLGWFWEEFNLRRPVELVVALEHVSQLSHETELPRPTPRNVISPAGMHVDEVQLKLEVGPAEMARASLRHTVVQEFINRVVQAYGYLRATYQFEQGWLHAPSGARTSMTLHPSVIYDHTQRFGRGAVLDDGSVFSGRSGDVVAFALDGVVVDLHGNTLATLELAPGRGCPDKFLALSPVDALPATIDDAPRAAQNRRDPPVVTGHASPHDLETVLDGQLL